MNVTLKIDPIAWAKIKWFMEEAGNLEMSGFGISSGEDPLHVVDFQTIEQVCHGAETELDDLALAKYVGQMAKKRIPPNRCMRIWFHSHPFAKEKPSPSTTDITTFKKKLGGEADWVVMVVLGKTGYFAQIYSALSFHPDRRVTLPVTLDIDWMGQLWSKYEEPWMEEYTANIKEYVAPKAKAVTVIKGFGGGRKQPRLYDNRGNRADGDADYPGYVAPATQIFREWSRSNCTLSLAEYKEALEGGFSPEEIETWDRMCLQFDAVAIRGAISNVGKDGKAKKQCSQALKENSKKNRKNRKSRKNRQLRAIVSKP